MMEMDGGLIRLKVKGRGGSFIQRNKMMKSSKENIFKKSCFLGIATWRECKRIQFKL